MKHYNKKKKNQYIEALSKIASKKDVASFKIIFDYFGPRLKSFLMSSGSTESIAEEIIQETMTIVWTKADYYNPKLASPSTWIYTIARNKKIDILRKSNKAILEDIEVASLPPIESKLEDDIELDQKFDIINKYLDDLPKDQLALLKLNFIEEKSHGEIAKITNIPLGTVKSRIRLAMEKIRTRIKNDGNATDLNDVNIGKNIK
ncbi:MAG: RNA polymerase subunit sigma [Pelagibacteraceae bacterium]|nr:RNA polymerase subunit sigma [Pelagibacteraceae bacterium]|tara:strand:- start:14 stop:625 length:612 start_codon:yes stop_codon:yes gene_type:complete